MRRLPIRVLWVALVLLAPCGLSGQENPQAEESSTKTNTPAQAPVTLDPAPLRSIFDDAVKILTEEKAANQASEERKERREQADLLAQQEMAKWAFWMVVVAAGQLVVGIVTIVFLAFAFG